MNREEGNRHRLFAAIVLVGTGLAAGCGGISEKSESSSGGKAASGGAAEAGTTSSGGAASGKGGTDGPSIILDGGGEGGAEMGPAPEPNPPDCPPEQWSCSDVACDGDTIGWSFPENCECDLTRPRAPSDCGDGLVFTCLGVTRTDDVVLDKPFAFSCSCLPDHGSCDAECSQIPDPGQFGMSCLLDFNTNPATLCGCAVVYLK